MSMLLGLVAPVALVGATLLDGTGAAPVKDSVVLVGDGRIACAGSRAQCPVPQGVKAVDVKGRWVVPGLVDAHVHFSQTGWADGRPDALDVREAHPYEEVQAELREHPERFFRSYLCSGVTAVFDVGGYPWSVAMARRLADGPDAPHVAAAGPLLSTRDHWLNLPAERQFLFLKDEESARTGVRYLKSIRSDAVKVWYIVSAERPVEASAPSVMAGGEAARRAGLPLLVHATGLAEAKVALRAGAKLLVHSVDDLPVDDEFLGLLKSSGAIYCPTLTVVSGYLRMFEAAAAASAPAIDDPNGCVDSLTRSRVAETARAPKPGEDVLERFRKRTARLNEVARANLKRVAAAGVPIAMGTDAGNPLTLHGPSVYAEMEAMEAAGLSPMQVLMASTRGGSLAMGREKELGTLEKGKAADLLVLDADPLTGAASFRKMSQVMRAGVLRNVTELGSR